MNRVSLVNLAALVVATGLSIFAGSARTTTRSNCEDAERRTSALAGQSATLSDGQRGLVDAGGHVTTMREYRRIVSVGRVADHLLIELCEPDRIAALSAEGAAHSPRAFQYAGKALIGKIDDIERVVVLRPDLVLANRFSDPWNCVPRLREAGVAVFDLGEMRGLATLLPQIAMVAELLGHPERGEQLTATLRTRLRALLATASPRPRRRALYLGVIGNDLFGGAPGSSYHDVLAYAGLDDAAEGRFVAWPHYSAEQVLDLDPDLVVTKTGMGANLCERPGFSALRPCRTPGAIVELAGDLIDDPGPAILDAAQELHALVYQKPQAIEQGVVYE
jgi:iron complex transport system substrate-binding protein